MTTADFIEKALRGTTTKQVCSSVFVDDGFGFKTVYSYGRHYPLATIIDGVAFINNVGYSSTTAKHINWASSAARNIVGSNNVHHIPLTNGDSFDPKAMALSVTREMDRLTDVMSTKKRKDTALYSDLQRQYASMVYALNVIAKLS